MVLIFDPSEKIAVDAGPTPKGVVNAAAVTRVRERITSFMVLLSLIEVKCEVTVGLRERCF